MKIGLSLSRCVRDIYLGKVDSHDVLVIIARTDFDPNIDEQWTSIWNGYRYMGGYSNPEWRMIPDEEEKDFRHLVCELYNAGMIHQPRKFGAGPTRSQYYWLEASLPDIELESRPAVKKAWENFQIVAGLSSTKKPFHDEF